MAATKTSTTPDELIWQGGVQPMKVGYGKLMMWIFLLSDTFTFSALLISYGLVRFSFPSFQSNFDTASKTITNPTLKMGVDEVIASFLQQLEA